MKINRVDICNLYIFIINVKINVKIINQDSIELELELIF